MNVDIDELRARRAPFVMIDEYRKALSDLDRASIKAAMHCPAFNITVMDGNGNSARATDVRDLDIGEEDGWQGIARHVEPPITGDLDALREHGYSILTIDDFVEPSS